MLVAPLPVVSERMAGLVHGGGPIEGRVILVSVGDADDGSV